jgi:hypothetical protein
MSAPILFADFAPGASLGTFSETYTPELAQAWQRIFVSSDQCGGGAAEGASMAVVLAMRAYLTVVAPRPPGNVHARQQFTLTALPRAGEAVRTVIRCASKEVKRDRFYVDLQVQGTGDGGRDVYRGCMSLIWAA